MDGGDRVTRDLVMRVADDELASILAEPAADADAVRRAHRLFLQVALADDFPDFLTLPAYDLID